ncbi:hypothetical protein V7P28_21190 [Klebsiella michiganensis]
MITALLIESWDIYSMAFILFALKDIYEPSSWLLGFTAAALVFPSLFFPNLSPLSARSAAVSDSPGTPASLRSLSG